ncbi:MAG: hypothetical protein CMK32_12665 [Porticoccaceae bacterium]|nr:hypothetical protein [Porticoccaceae bacterium]
MSTMRALIGCGVVSLAATPSLASAGDDDVSTWLEFGAGLSENGNGRFGEYRQLLQTDRAFALGAVGYQWRDGDDRYRSGGFHASADLAQNLAGGYLARQGDYRIGFDLREFEAISRERFVSVYPGDGSVQSLPPDYAGLAGARGFVGHAGVRRQQGSLDLMRRWGQWRLTATLASEDKEGTRITGASERFGDAVLIPAPVDQRQDTVDLQLAYQGGQWVLNTGWYYARYTNHARSLTFANPVNTTAPLRTLDLAPDNDISRISLDGHYRFGPARQVSWYISRADARQDDGFLEPLMPAGSALIDSLDARRVDTDLRLAYRAQVNARFGYRLRWDYRDRDNRTDVLPISATGFSHLYDHRRQRWSADARYRLPGQWRLRAGLEFEAVERTTRSDIRFRDDLDTTQLWSELRLPDLGALALRLKVVAEERDSDLSDAREASISAPSQALPEYLLAGRSTQYQVSGDLPLSERTLLAGSYRRINDDFDNPAYGLRGRTSDEVSLNVSWQPRKALAVSAYALYQAFEISQNGLEFHPTGSPSYANAPWRQWIDDDSRTVGINFRWQVSPALDASLDISHSDNDSDYRSRWLADADTGEVGGTSDTLPGFGVDTQRIESTVNWQYRPDLRFTVRYLFERFRGDDWAWDAADFTALGFGWGMPSYDGHAVMVSVRHDFDSL